MFDPREMSLDGMSAMMRIWSDAAFNAMQGGAAGSADPTSPEAAHNSRAAILAAWSQAWDQFVRTPEFLAWMRLWLAAGAQWQKVMTDLCGRMQQQALDGSRQGIDQAVPAGQQSREPFAAGMEMIARQLRQLGERIGAIEEGFVQEREERQKKRAGKNGTRPATCPTPMRPRNNSSGTRRH